MKKIIIFLLAVISFSWADFTCPPEFHAKCSCKKTNYNYKEMFVVNCTNENFNHPTILRKLPSETQVLIFTGMQV